MIRRPAVLLLCAWALVAPSCALVGLAPRCDGKEVIAEFEQVGDLVENANVQSSDVVIGRVQNIDLADWKARVTMCLEESQRLPVDDLEAVVRTTSLLGEKFVDLKVNASGEPYLEDGDVIGVDSTSKASELEDVFTRLAAVLGSGNLEQINRFTSAQAKILRNHTGDVREVIRRLRSFTDVLDHRKEQVAASIDSLDAVSDTILQDSDVLEDFLASFADSTAVLEDQKEQLQTLLFSLDRFTKITVQLLEQTERGLNEQFDDLRPVLSTIAANSGDLQRSLRTLATFLEWFPETMPGDYLQLDVCQVVPETYGQGETCPQDVRDDDPDRTGSHAAAGGADGAPLSGLELILRQPLKRGE